MYIVSTLLLPVFVVGLGSVYCVFLWACTQAYIRLAHWKVCYVVLYGTAALGSAAQHWLLNLLITIVKRSAYLWSITYGSFVVIKHWLITIDWLSTITYSCSISHLCFLSCASEIVVSNAPCLILSDFLYYYYCIIQIGFCYCIWLFGENFCTNFCMKLHLKSLHRVANVLMLLCVLYCSLLAFDV